MYDCQTLAEDGITCIEWVAAAAAPVSSHYGLSQEDAHFVGVWLVECFVMFCVYAMIAKAIKKS